MRQRSGVGTASHPACSGLGIPDGGTVNPSEGSLGVRSGGPGGAGGAVDGGVSAGAVGFVSGSASGGFSGSGVDRRGSRCAKRGAGTGSVRSDGSNPKT